MKDKLKKILPIIVLILITLIVALLSYDNPFAKIGTGGDSKVFREVVNQMNHGGAPYKDGFDHKGPILYIIDWIGVNITVGGLDGIWVMQCIAIFITVFFTYKILTKSFGLKIIESLILDFIININVIFYLEEGNLTETYALPLITTTLYLILRLNNSNYKKYNFLIGMFMAIVAFLRVNMIAIWIVYYLYVLVSCIKNKQYKQLWNIIKYAFLGVLSIALIVGLYLLITGSLIYCIKDYILFNIKYGTTSKASLIKIGKHYIENGDKYYYVFVLFSIIVMFFKKEKFIKWFSLEFFLLSLFIVVQPRNLYLHYATIMIPTFVVPTAYIYKKIIEDKKIKTVLKYTVTIIIGVYLMIVPVKSYGEIFKKVNIIQPDTTEMTSLIEYIKENTNESESILVVGSNCEIYTKTDRKSASRYMFQYPIFKVDPNILPQVKSDIENNKPKYLVIIKIYLNYGMQDFVNEITEDKYKKVVEYSKYEIYERGT